MHKDLGMGRELEEDDARAMKTTSIKVVGLDPAFSNFGIAVAEITLPTFDINITGLSLLKTTKQSGKLVRVSSDDLRRGKEIYEFFKSKCGTASLVFSEIPSGSQSAIASKGLGIALGILTSCPVPIIEVTALEVKKAAVGKKNATKQEMIDWATSKYPKADWLTKKRNGKTTFTNDNEHLADAIAVIHAGIMTPQFKQVIDMFKAIN